MPAAAKSRLHHWMAVVVLCVALAATWFSVWREEEIYQRDNQLQQLSPASPWAVLVIGVGLSVLLYLLFAVQNRLRAEAERANELLLLKDEKILALSRSLEEKIAARTEELNAALAKERELNRLKSNFISIITHETRTPLAIILGSVEILSRYYDRLPSEKRVEHLRTIDSAVQRMTELLEDVLVFSKAEAGRLEFDPTEIDLKAFCLRLVEELQASTHQRCPIEVAVNLTETARADETMMRHILTNLITNAVKYSPPGKPVRFSVSRDEGAAIFVVQDSGMGISEEDQKNLFTPFHRGKNVTTLQGSGLGLVIVKHCVERHGGRVSVESSENVGTTVRVWLPLFSPAHTEFVKRFLTPAKA